MGRNISIVKYESTDFPRNYEFYDVLENEFKDYDSNGNIYIEKHHLDEWLEENPELKEKFKEEMEILQTLLKENDDCVELSIS